MKDPESKSWSYFLGKLSVEWDKQKKSIKDRKW